MKHTKQADKLRLPTVAVHYDVHENIYEARLTDKGDVPFPGPVEDYVTVGDTPDDALKGFRKTHKLDALNATNAKGDKLDSSNPNKVMDSIAELVDPELLTSDQVEAYREDLKMEGLRDKVLEVFTTRKDSTYVSRMSDDIWETSEQAYISLSEELEVLAETALETEAEAILSNESPQEPLPTRKTPPKGKSDKPKAGKTPKVDTTGMITVANLASRYHTQGSKIRRILRPFYQANDELAGRHDHQARWAWHPEDDKPELEKVYAELDRSFNIKN